jgi:NTP pyrophosphatase (non-canonical NTP hydrolase)
VNLDKISQEIHDNAVNKGFWDENNGVNFYFKQIAMIHSEATECLEAIRKERGEKQIVLELVDIIIRVCDLYGGLVEDEYVHTSLQEALLEKMEYNKGRDKMHGVLG